MSANSAQARHFASLLKKLRSTYEPQPYETRDPITHLVFAFLQWEATRKQAEAALSRIAAAVVDNNELRVSHNNEVIRMIGTTYPRCEERVARMRESLQEIYVREHAVSLDSVIAKGRKDARTYMDSLPGITPYAAAYTLLLAFNTPALPIDDKLASLLETEGCVDEGADPAHAASIVEKLIKPDEALTTHLLLQAWSDDRKSTAKSNTRPAKKAATIRKKK